ncbi:Uncharacterized GPI-anchored protein At1g61900 [Linum grandiflorum]
MDGGVSLNRLDLAVALFLLLLSLQECNSMDPWLPELSPNGAPQPFLPLLAPSPLSPFTNSTIPRLSGECMLNFTAAESLMSTTSIDCSAFFAPLLANVICCPQLEATLTVLIGQASRSSNLLALSSNASRYCLSDIEQMLIGQGAAGNLPFSFMAAVCPLVFPNMKHVAKGCSSTIHNETECCEAMDSYVSHLQKQSLITNLQALDCSTTLAMKLQKSNITSDIYSLCHISLKDFSLQDLNDNIPAPWPSSSSQLSASSCNKSMVN